MRQVVVFVEGVKDAYFLYELLLRRAAVSFPPEKNVAPPKKPGNPPFKLASADGTVRVDIYWTGGYTEIGGLKDRLKRPASMEDSDEFASAVVFDSDTPPESGPNETQAGQQARRKDLLDRLGVEESKRDMAGKWIYLFVDNDEVDGDLEDVLRGLVKATSEHEAFFTSCWEPFVNKVMGLPANRPTDKSMMNEYKAAFNDEAWDMNGLNRCYADDDLWDWSSETLAQLVRFLDKLLSGPVEAPLSDFLS